MALGQKMSLLTDNTLTVDSPPFFHLTAKPSGATCNIDCKYCLFLSKEAPYPNDRQRMSEKTLETYLQQLLESHRAGNQALSFVSTHSERDKSDTKFDPDRDRNHVRRNVSFAEDVTFRKW
jgi:2-iminoacetate synthase ThiH